jgi:error-prone DNA polymerase
VKSAKCSGSIRARSTARADDGQFEFVDPAETLARNLAEAGLNPDDERSGCSAGCGARCRICCASRSALGRNGALSGRLDEVVPLENASMPGRVVVQWDKDDRAIWVDQGDLLGLGMMAVLEEAIQLSTAN